MIAWTPIEQIPETSAFSSIYPEIRVSLPMMILETCPFFLEKMRGGAADVHGHFRRHGVLVRHPPNAVGTE